MGHNASSEAELMETIDKTKLNIVSSRHNASSEAELMETGKKV